jgi:hypothetical protein
MYLRVAEKLYPDPKRSAERENFMGRKRKATSLDEDATSSASTPKKKSRTMQNAHGRAPTSPQPTGEKPLEYIPLVRDTKNLVGVVIFDRIIPRQNPKTTARSMFYFGCPVKSSPRPLANFIRCARYGSLLSLDVLKGGMASGKARRF